MQPKKYTNPKIALLNIELELKAERENAEIRVDSVEVYIFRKFFFIYWHVVFISNFENLV